LLNAHFVPVYISNEDYDENGAAGKEEKSAWRKIYLEALAERRDTGAVCVYLVAANGDGFDSLVVSQACEEGRLAAMLASAVARHNVAAGKPVVAPRPQSLAPAAKAGEMVLHLVSRIDHRYSWGEFPAENWIVLSREEQRQFVPTPADVGRRSATPTRTVRTSTASRRRRWRRRSSPARPARRGCGSAGNCASSTRFTRTRTTTIGRPRRSSGMRTSIWIRGRCGRCG
jgi:hypothetical protein